MDHTAEVFYVAIEEDENSGDGICCEEFVSTCRTFEWYSGDDMDAETAQTVTPTTAYRHHAM